MFKILYFFIPGFDCVLYIFLYIFLAGQSVLATPLLMSPILYFLKMSGFEPKECALPTQPPISPCSKHARVYKPLLWELFLWFKLSSSAHFSKGQLTKTTPSPSSLGVLYL
jgi:hypothetical protein